jgi:hypothetical protein
MNKIIFILLGSSVLGSVVSSIFSLIINYKVSKNTLFKIGLEKEYNIRMYCIKKIYKALKFLNNNLNNKINHIIEDEETGKKYIISVNDNYIKAEGQYKNIKCFLSIKNSEVIDKLLIEESNNVNSIYKDFKEGKKSDPYKLSGLRETIIDEIKKIFIKQIREYL